MAFRSGLRPLAPEGAHPSAGIGCAPLGKLFAPVSDAESSSTVGRAFERGVRFFDTAPHYGEGLSEIRLGKGLRGIDRDKVTIATKVGRTIVDAYGDPSPVGAVGEATVGDLTRDGILRGVEGSLLRLDTHRIDLLYLHDPGDVDEALRTAMPTLQTLRDEGVVRAIGVGMVYTDPLIRFARESDVDVIMPAGRLTLLDRSANDELLPVAFERGIGIVAAGVFNSGILADPINAPYYEYQEASTARLREAMQMQEACRRYGLTLAHVSAAYPMRFDAVEAVVVGARNPEEVDSFADGIAIDVPSPLWEELEFIHSSVAAE